MIWGHFGMIWGHFGAHLGGHLCDPHSCLPGPKIAAFHPKTGIWGGLGGILGSFRAHLGHLGVNGWGGNGRNGRFWGGGFLWGSFGESNVFAQICPNLGHFGSLWAILSSDGTQKMNSWGHLGSFWAHFGAFWGDLGLIWGPLGVTLRK